MEIVPALQRNNDSALIIALMNQLIEKLPIILVACHLASCGEPTPNADEFVTRDGGYDTGSNGRSEPPETKGIPTGQPLLAKVNAKDNRFGIWVEFTVGKSSPVRIDLTAMSDRDFSRFADRLLALELGQEMAVTFGAGSEPESFVLAGLDNPSTILNQTPKEILPNPPNGTLIIRQPETQDEADFTGSQVSLKEVDMSVTFPGANDLTLPPYRFPP